MHGTDAEYAADLARQQRPSQGPPPASDDMPEAALLAQGRVLGLQREPVFYASQVDPRAHLRRCGATAEACAVLVQRQVVGSCARGWVGERIARNAMPLQPCVTWREAPLTAAGGTKRVPDAQMRGEASRYLPP